MRKTWDAELLRISKTYNAPVYICKILQGCAKAARRELRRSGVRIPSMGKGWPKLNSEASKIQRRAMEILFKAKTLENLIASNTLGAAEIAVEAYVLGQLALHAHLGPIAGDLNLGRSVRASGIKGSIDHYGTLAERRIKWQPLLAEFKRISRPGMSARSAHRILAKNHRCSESTIRARLKIAST